MDFFLRSRHQTSKKVQKRAYLSEASNPEITLTVDPTTTHTRKSEVIQVACGLQLLRAARDYVMRESLDGTAFRSSYASL